MDPGNWDLRIVAGVLAVISLSGGIFLNFLPLAVITVILGIAVCILVFTPTGPPGTSAGLGLLYLVVGGFLFLTVPAWIGYGIKSIVLATN